MDKNTLFCFRCYHSWKPRKENLPKVCPKCKSRSWNKPRQKATKNLVVPMIKAVVTLHDEIIKRSGGEHGIRDEGGIYNSVSKLLNYQFKNKKDPINIGVVTFDEFARRHFFVDGNKRTAYALAKILMLVNRCHLKINYLEATEFIRRIAEYDSKIDFEKIKNWLKNNCYPITEKELENYLSRGFFDIVFGGDEDGKK